MANIADFGTIYLKSYHRVLRHGTPPKNSNKILSWTIIHEKHLIHKYAVNCNKFVKKVKIAIIDGFVIKSVGKAHKS
jgi:hypothetical protein